MNLIIKMNSNYTSQVDYGSLNDALVWAYVFTDVGIPLNCGQ
jgi:hypothetical protein